MPEAPLDDSGSGLAPAGDGWFVVNVRDAQWLTSENGAKQPSGSECAFESQKFEFPQLGIRLHAAETSDPRQAYVRFEPSRRERPSYWDRLPWA